MNNSKSITKIIRRFSTLLLLLTVLIQLVSVILMEVEFDKFEVEEIHEISGFTFFGLLIVHIVLFRKSIMNLMTKKIS
jgi:hypothetical protein